jgi:hypothetical protein
MQVGKVLTKLIIPFTVSNLSHCKNNAGHHWCMMEEGASRRLHLVIDSHILNNSLPWEGLFPFLFKGNLAIVIMEFEIMLIAKGTESIHSCLVQKRTNFVHHDTVPIFFPGYVYAMVFSTGSSGKRR